ncbi:UDP-glucose flavonoid 3-O-glucosyltransferase 7-like [Neltuma alba]|uniref:UDP-glucose flavonoid 3-O-glucosyltransferase 7-like n=1 Tax=Neltuma alba TaxID=207710 RepID=UPI0010A3B7C9|nr:UDP-glucose flavonoid 3-O-glucosyltransferase 7-like [Prosopis alba]
MAIPKPLKVYFLPFFAQGHLIPLSQFARLFAARGVHVTIITTPLNAEFIQKFIDQDKSSGHRVLIDIHTVRFPSQEAGLPEGTENFFNVKDVDTGVKMYIAAAMLRPHVEPFIEQNPPDCIVSDFLFTWSGELASRLGIPRLTFNSFCTFAVCMIDAVHKHFIDKDSSDSLDDHETDPFGAVSKPSESHDHEYHQSDEPFVVPGLPHPISLTLQPPKRFSKDLAALNAAMKTSYGLIVNNFNDLDCKEYVDYYRKISGHKVWHIGPASLMLRNTLPQKDHLLQHQQTSDEHEYIRSWLDSKKPNSVVFIGFGSLCYFPDTQLFEIACAMESSGHSFIWMVHKEDDEEGKKAWLPEGFEERMKKENRGLILTKWAPQELILNHPATGGFLTHCGWTSLTEAVGAGVPLITWPMFAEQFYNEKLITQVHGFGVEVGAEEWTRTPYDVMQKVVSRVKIEIAVRRLMDGGEEAEGIRRKARDMRDKAREAVEEGGSSQRNLTALIEDLRDLSVSRRAH